MINEKYVKRILLIMIDKKLIPRYFSELFLRIKRFWEIKLNQKMKIKKVFNVIIVK